MCKPFSREMIAKKLYTVFSNEKPKSVEEIKQENIIEEQEEMILPGFEELEEKEELEEVILPGFEENVEGTSVTMLVQTYTKTFMQQVSLTRLR